ncbi:MAG: methylmalonyl-CoA carboxyltransferase [Chloroflexota bacterium]|nr:MAG: methylmalonyl-CoA carboxyltransferase [Chloroflexota bacterium]
MEQPVTDEKQALSPNRRPRPGENGHQALINELQEMRQKIVQGGGLERIEAQHAKGKLTARERILRLLDDGTFREIGAYIVQRHTDFGLDKEHHPGDAVVTGFGKIDGRRVCIYAQDFTILGGSFSEAVGQKVAQIMDLAMEAGIPVVGLIDSGGARIQEGVYSLAAYGELFWRNTQASGVIPQISVILGPCAGGAVYSPALTDFIIMTKGTGQMFITGPEVVKAVTGEQVDMETLGGAMTHSAVSGVAHFAADDEDHALELTRQLLHYLPANNVEPAPAVHPTDDPWRMDPELNTIVPTDPNEAYDMKMVIQRVFDPDSFLEIQEYFAQNAIIGFARLHGQVVGVVAQQPMILAGVIDIDASDKIARFVRFCDAFNIPIITFSDSPGFLPGVHQEHGGIIRHGAKIVYAYSEATVPKLTVVTRKGYGGAYIVMGSKHIHADLVFAWPTTEIAVMGADGAINILYRKQLKEAADPAAVRAELIAEYEQKFSKPYVAAAAGAIDDILIPAETRPRLIAALELLRDKRVKAPAKKHSTMPL